MKRARVRLAEVIVLVRILSDIEEQIETVRVSVAEPRGTATATVRKLAPAAVIGLEKEPVNMASKRVTYCN